MKVIFLDIDGVLVTRSHLTVLLDNGMKSTDSMGRHVFDPKCIDNLKKIVDATGAKIVLSSTWKVFGWEMFQLLWKERNMPGEVIAFTPNKNNRGTEIDDWMNGTIRFQHPNVESFVIIDDDIHDLLIGQFPHIVHTTFEHGLTSGDVDNAIRILNIVKKEDDNAYINS